MNLHDQLNTAADLRRTGENEQARQLLVALLAEYPDHPEANYHCACVHDALGLEREAIPFYVKALQLPLPPEQRRSAFLGLGSTYRCLGEYEAAVQTLEQGRAEFPQAQEFVPFLAMAWYNTGRPAEAVELLLTCLVETSANEDILSYQRAILFYANKLDQTW